MWERIWNRRLFLAAGTVSTGWLIDLRDATRSLRAGRATTVLALAILTLGIGAATVTFSALVPALRASRVDPLVALRAE
jgi:hypothetical protein